MKRLIAVCGLALIAEVASAQIVRVSGRILEEGSRTPIGGAVVRLAGSDSTMTTGPSGTFTFGGVLGGRVILTVSAPAYEFRSIPLEIAADTVLTIAMRRRVVSLDPMVVRPRQLKIRGTAIDSATGEAILFAQVSLYPEARYVEASNIGRFTFDRVGVGEVTILVEAMEYLPKVVRFNAARDTVLTVGLSVDSVALRVIGVQAARLADRAEGSPFTLRAYTRDLIARERRSTVGELVDRLMLVPNDPARRQGKSAQDACVFYDDRKIAPGMLDGLYPELIERVEVYHHGGMIRVYSKRYVMSLMGKASLQTVTYMTNGLRTVCE